MQQSMTLAFLENQLAAALTLQSAQEYRYWLLIYARFLVNEGTKTSLKSCHTLVLDSEGEYNNFKFLY